MTTVDLQLEGRLLLGQRIVERGVVQIGQGRVLWSGPHAAAPRRRPRRRRAVDGLIAPGYVDLHVHGGGGADAADGTARSIRRLCRVHARHGTVALCPTVLSAPPEVMLRALAAIRRACEAAPDGARVLGAHLEGPFLSPRRAGAQPAAHLRAPDSVLLEELLAAAGPSLRVVTLAPELPGALDLVKRLVERGVVVALGHSDATFAQAEAAVAAGARLVTHAFNAMAPLHHREPGLIGAALLEERLVVEAIADGVHVASPALRLLRRVKPRRVALVTDCTAALEARRGGARLGATRVAVRDGAARLADGTLAGSVLTMERAVASFVSLAGASVSEAVAAASRVPLRLLGEHGGTLAAGDAADLVVLDDELRVQTVLVEGQELGR
jgi:N-acetylglucosamine-6-phosphate deacetylase